MMFHSQMSRVEVAAVVEEDAEEDSRADEEVEAQEDRPPLKEDLKVHHLQMLQLALRMLESPEQTIEVEVEAATEASTHMPVAKLRLWYLRFSLPPSADSALIAFGVFQN